jgi:pimeloyl-ACP methyl ester carboxylesterase
MSLARHLQGERLRLLPGAGHATAAQVTIPVGFTTFPDEIFRAPRSWVERAYPTLTYFNEADPGGHFAAWEQPELFATEIHNQRRACRDNDMLGPRTGERRARWPGWTSTEWAPSTR